MTANNKSPGIPVWIFASVAFAFLILAEVVYVHSLSFPIDLYGDDAARILGQWDNLNKDLVTAMTSMLVDRPLVAASIWANLKVFGPSVWALRFFAVFIHSLTASMVSLLSLLLLAETEMRRRLILSIGVGAIFLLHPLNTQAVFIIVQRGVTLGSFFGLLSLALYLKSRLKVDVKGRETAAGSTRLGSVFFYILGILAKPFVLIIPILLILWEVCGTAKTKSADGVALRKSRAWTAATIAPYFLGWVIPIFFYKVLAKNQQINSMSGIEYFQIQLRVLWTYLRLFFLPFHLHFFYDFNLHAPLWQTLIAGLGHVVLLSLIFHLRKKNPTACFSFFAMYLCFLPESSFFPIDDVAFEHRAYFPMAFALLGSAALFKNTRLSNQKLILGFFLIAVPLGAANIYRQYEIDSPVKFLANTHRFSPRSLDLNLRDSASFYNLRAYAQAQDVLAEVRPSDEGQIYYELMRNVIGYAKMNPTDQLQFLDQVAEKMRSSIREFPHVRPRHFFNTFVIAEYSKKYSEFDRALKIEWLLRPQLYPMLWFDQNLSEDEHLFSLELNAYQTSAMALLAAIDRHATSKLGKNELVRSLSARAGLAFYFDDKNQDIQNLEKDYDRLLKKFAGDPEIQSEFDQFKWDLQRRPSRIPPTPGK